MSHDPNPSHWGEHGQYPQPNGYENPQPQSYATQPDQYPHGQYQQQGQYQYGAYPQNAYQQYPHPPVGGFDAPPRSVQVQRVLLWILAVLTFINAVGHFVMRGADAFAAGYALNYVLVGVVLVVLACNIKRGARWVRITQIVLYIFLMIVQFGTFTGGNPFALIGFGVCLFGLVLVLRASSREYFRKVRVQLGYGTAGYGPGQHPEYGPQPGYPYSDGQPGNGPQQP